MDNETLMELTADIVSAHVGHNRVDAGDVPKLIKTVYNALAGTGQPAPAPQEALQPKVSIRSSLKPDAITCLDCGAKMKMLKRHLVTDHGLTPDAYRARWGLLSDYPMVAPEYSGRRRELAKKIGLGRKPGEKATTRKTRSRSAEAATSADA